MNCGIVIFAHNNRQIDYVKLSMISALLAKKNLDKPVSLITDPSTADWMKESNVFEQAAKIFDKIIITQRPESGNNRLYRDGKDKIAAPFNNTNRDNVWYLTPYERTLLIDSDYIILSDVLNEYWNVDSSFLISNTYKDILGDHRIGYLDKNVSETGVKLLWATTIMFTKNQESKVLFDLVDYIKENYKQFSDTYRFNPSMFRNDIAFSIANHILYGWEDSNDYTLPSVLSSPDMDFLYDVKEKLKFIMLANDGDSYTTCSIQNKDLHIMNKQSLLRNYDKIMEQL